eukprot:TRINITY_DN11432_c0_g1_i1.p1 TRINITY_DN11432_c0_g1~~TRINITY_DN11432_c0_g1_i1.p1  ORF type:complete len:100 (-),score=0.66 TRINITY_DN11432_c0_g1_i1:32-331(-)
MPLFSQDKEEVLGQSAQAKAFYEKLGQADAIIISFAEHNGSYTADIQKFIDWTSRIDMKSFYKYKPIGIIRLTYYQDLGERKSVVNGSNSFSTTLFRRY